MNYRLIQGDRGRRPRTVESRRWRKRLSPGRTIAVLPTLFTLGNLLCGFLAIFFASRPADTPMPWNWTPLTFAALLIFLGMAFDGLDGRIARLTRQTSDLGEQLDSMSDMVTFGAAPAFIAVQLARVQTPFVSEVSDHTFDRVALIVACIYVACAALRLARFNIEVKSPENSDHMHFKGLPSPGAAGTVASLVLLHQNLVLRYTGRLVEDPTLLPPLGIHASAIAMVAIMLLSALAMVSRLRYVHVTNRYLRGRAPFGYFVKAIIVLALLLIWPIESIATAFVLYAVSAPISWLWRRLRGRAAVMPASEQDPATPAEAERPHQSEQQAG